MSKRRVAAEWIESLTGVPLPYSSDNAFRAALKDGVLLCKTLNSVFPGMIPKIIEDMPSSGSPGGKIKMLENVQNFLRAVNTIRLPADCLFSVADLESTGWEDRPRIVDCILQLKRLAEASSQWPYVKALKGPSGGEEQPITPARGVVALSVKTPVFPQQTSPNLADLQSLPNRMYASPPCLDLRSSSKSFHAAAGVTRLMQQCTAMLRERMYVDSAQKQAQKFLPLPPSASASSASPEHAMEAMGPVLESVLSSLTQEYEKRLLQKDHELSNTKDQLAGVQKKLVGLQSELTALKDSTAQETTQASREAVESVRAELEALQCRYVVLQGQLTKAESQNEDLLEVLKGKQAERDNRAALLEGEVLGMRKKLEELQDLEGRYRSVKEENRRLYNQVQDLQGSIRVFCRVRPLGLTGDLTPSCVEVGMDGEVAVYEKGERKMYKFDRIFDGTSAQMEVYEDTQALIRSVLDGYNVCIFAYGQTGSGKTHTMAGTMVPGDAEGLGINYRALYDLFALRDARAGEVEYTIKVQMLEIYNENLRDLLLDGSSGGSNKLDILNTQASGCNVPNAIQLEVHSPEDVAEIMARGERNRHTSETKMNDRSSRSHQILTVIVDGSNTLNGSRSHSCLHLVDLAGSERVGRSEASGERLIEAQHINKSLSALGDVMAALANKQTHVPFRNSKLTQLLADSLSGQAKVMMFVHVAPEQSMSGESTSTLKFASRVSEITLGQAKKNVESGKVFEANEQVCRLRQALESKDRQMEQLHLDLNAEREEKSDAQRERDAMHHTYQKDIGELKAQLEAAKRASALSTTSTPLPPCPEHGHSRVPRLKLDTQYDQNVTPLLSSRSSLPSLACDTSPLQSMEITEVTPLASKISAPGGMTMSYSKHIDRLKSARSHYKPEEDTVGTSYQTNAKKDRESGKAMETPNTSRISRAFSSLSQKSTPTTAKADRVQSSRQSSVYNRPAMSAPQTSRIKGRFANNK